MTTHAIGHHEDRQFLVDKVVVLVVRALAPDVRCSPKAQVHVAHRTARWPISGGLNYTDSSPGQVSYFSRRVHKGTRRERFGRGGSRPAPRPRSKFADFTPPAAEPLARLAKNCPINGQFFSPEPRARPNEVPQLRPTAGPFSTKKFPLNWVR